MLILAIQTALEPAGLALLQDDELLAEEEIRARFEVCQKLSSTISSMLAAHKAAAGDVGLIAVVTGPGSFTGIRIGLATAKALAHSLRRPIVGANALELAAWEHSRGAPADVVVAAGSDRFFVARYSGALQPLAAPAQKFAGALPAWLQSCPPPADRQTILLGWKDKTPLPSWLDTRGPVLRPPGLRAAALGRLALACFAAGRFQQDPLALQPLYLRASSPEERASAR